MGFVSLNPSYRRFPDAAQRDSGATLIRDRHKLRVSNDPGSTAHRFVMRCARDKRQQQSPGLHGRVDAAFELPLGL
jgi:hypothetical protein